VGNFTIAYAGLTPLLIATSNEGTVRVSLIVNMTGFNGTDPLELEYSTTASQIWIPYKGTIATGTANYYFPRSVFSIEGGVLNIRISRQQMNSGTTSMNYTGNNSPEIEMISPVSGSTNVIYELPLASPNLILFTLSITDADRDDHLRLHYRINNGPLTLFGPVNRGGSVSVLFPISKLVEEGLVTRTIHFYRV
jgi:hypothetical protein